MLGRFIQADPVIPGTGSQALNRFSYSFNNPVKYNDPSGHFPISGEEDDFGRPIPDFSWRPPRQTDTSLDIGSQSHTDNQSVGLTIGAVGAGAVGAAAVIGSQGTLPGFHQAQPPATLYEQAIQLHNQLKGIASEMRTTAVAYVINEKGEVIRLAASSDKQLNSAQLKLLMQWGGIAIRDARDLHAEERIYEYLSRRPSWQLIEIAAYNLKDYMCASCAMKALHRGGMPVSPIEPVLWHYLLTNGGWGLGGDR